jgi:hypothetical protein
VVQTPRDEPAHAGPQADQGLCDGSQAGLRPGSKRIHPAFIETPGVRAKRQLDRRELGKSG